MTTDALITAIQRRLTDISEQQHALRRSRKARLVEQLTPLRLGILAPDMAVAQLKAKGVKLRRLPAGPIGRPASAPRNAGGDRIDTSPPLRWSALGVARKDGRRHGKPLNART